MEGLFTFVIIVVWVLVGVLNMLKKRAEMAEKSRPGQGPKPAVPPRPARPRPRTPAAPPVFSPKREAPPPVFMPKREEGPPAAAPLRRTQPAPLGRQPVRRPTARRTTAQPSQLFGPPRPDILEVEEAFEQRAATRPPRRERPPQPAPARPAKRPRQPTPRPAARLQHREARQRFHFTDNPVVNGIIFSELFGPPVAKRPFHRRRMF